MVNGFRKDALTVAVVTASCTASPTFFIKTAVRSVQFCINHATKSCFKNFNKVLGNYICSLGQIMADGLCL